MRNLATIISLAAIATTAAAQNQTLVTQIEVDRTVVPELKTSHPLPGVQPRPLDFDTTPTGLSLAEPTGMAENYAAAPVEVFTPAATGVPTPDNSKGYIWVGYFPAFNAGIGAGYNLLDNATTQATVSAQYSGFSYGNGSEQAGYNTVSSNELTLLASINHLLTNKMRLNAGIRYGLSALATPGSLDAQKYKRNINDLGLNASLSGHSESVDYAAGVEIAYNHFSPTGIPPLGSARETPLRIFGNAHFNPENAVSCALDADLTIKNREGLQLAEQNKLDHIQNTATLFNFTPSIIYKASKTRISIAPVVSLGSNLNQATFHIAPRITAAYIPTAAFSAYATAHGGVRATGLATAAAYTPFAVSPILNNAAVTPYNLTAGLSFGPKKGFWGTVHASYARTRHAPMLTLMPTAVATLAEHNISGFKTAVALGWRSDEVQISLCAQKLQQGAGKGFADAPDMPGYILHASAQVAPSPKIRVLAAWKAGMKRRYYLLAPQNTTLCPLRNTSDLSLDATYKINPNIAAFIRLDNILCRRAEILPGIRQNTLNGLLGVVYTL